MNPSINECLDVLYNESREFYLSDEVDTAYNISALDFCRDYVQPNKPVIIKGGCAHWPATKKWNKDYFRQVIPNKKVTVAITPNGLADGIAEKDGQDYLVMPYEEEMTMNKFLDSLDNKREDYVPNVKLPYSELNELRADILSDIPFAAGAFGLWPDSAYFSMGDERAVTSMQKDGFENIFCVIDGYKDFILVPQIDLPYIPYKLYKDSQFKHDNGIWDIEPSSRTTGTEWISIDPLNPDLNKYPEYVNAQKYHIRLNKGDMLYIPCLWFHHSRQSHGCIAVNYFYDMRFNLKHCYIEMLKKMCNKTFDGY